MDCWRAPAPTCPRSRRARCARSSIPRTTTRWRRTFPSARRPDRARWIEKGDVVTATIEPRGPVPVRDAVVLSSGRLLAAQGEAGVALLGRTGAALHRFDCPADGLVISDASDRAIALAARGESAQLTQLDLPGRRQRSWGLASLAGRCPDVRRQRLVRPRPACVCWGSTRWPTRPALLLVGGHRGRKRHRRHPLSRRGGGAGGRVGHGVVALRAPWSGAARAQADQAGARPHPILKETQTRIMHLGIVASTGGTVYAVVCEGRDQERPRAVSVGAARFEHTPFAGGSDRIALGRRRRDARAVRARARLRTRRACSALRQPTHDARPLPVPRDGAAAPPFLRRRPRDRGGRRAADDLRHGCRRPQDGGRAVAELKRRDVRSCLCRLALQFRSPSVRASVGESHVYLEVRRGTHERRS